MKEAGVLGINARNRDYIFPNNRRRYYPLVDNKLETKRLAESAGIACPPLYGVVEFQQQVSRLENILGEHRDFAVKPAKGSGGGGIIVIADRHSGGYVRTSGGIISMPDLKYHINNILSGLYSLGGANDVAMIEYRVRPLQLFKDISYQGVPDIRVIIYQGVPAMAMLRLPTRESDGKANLHMGGVGVGVKMDTGMTFGGIQRGAEIGAHPDTAVKLDDIVIPDWTKLLTIASRFESLINMGYIGVDIVIDEVKGPLILEVNARPGIAIQIANRCGLLHRLRAVDAHIAELSSPEEKVAFAQENFK